MFSRLLLVVGAATALPFPQLTEEEFLAPVPASARARSLDDPQDVFITSSYTQVRRQGRMGAEDNIKFPTLEVRDPNELRRGPIQNTLFATGPVYKKSTAEIEKKIKEINTVLKAKLEAQEAAVQEQVTALEMEEALEAMAEIDAMTDLAAAEIVAEELAEVVAEAELKAMVDLKIAEVILEEEAELEASVGGISWRTQLSEELTKEELEAAFEEAVIKEEAELEAAVGGISWKTQLSEELTKEELEAAFEEAVIEEAVAELEENIVEAEEAAIEEEAEESSTSLPTLDFGDITEVAV